MNRRKFLLLIPLIGLAAKIKPRVLTRDERVRQWCAETAALYRNRNLKRELLRFSPPELLRRLSVEFEYE